MTKSVQNSQGSQPTDSACSCAHCGLPVPRSAVTARATEQFCCAGCEAVYAMLHSCGLDEYYRLKEAFDEGGAAPAKVSGKSFDYLDDPEFLRRHAVGRAKGGVKIELYLDGVHCIACSWLIEKVLMEREGAAFARLNLGKSVLEVVFDPTRVRLSKLARALDRIGYTPHPLAGESATDAARKESRRLMARLGVAAACAGNIMLLAVSTYFGEHTGMDPVYASLFRWISLGLALPAVLYSAWPFYRGAWAGLRNRQLHMDLPISLGIGAAFAVSLVATVLERGEVYYDSVSMLIAALLAGRLLLVRAGHWAANSAEGLLQLESKTARRVSCAGGTPPYPPVNGGEFDGGTPPCPPVNGGEFEGEDEIPVADVRVGDTLRVLPGETVPVDGVISGEAARVTQAHLTGEPFPVRLETGDPVYAGAIAVEAPLTLMATAVGETTRLHRLADFMRDSAARRAPVVNIADRIAGWFVGVVIGLAVITAIVWTYIDPARALWNAAAMLIVTCPCALGLATPIALAIAMGRAARKGIFIKGADGVERLAGIHHVILDKTGTVTQGSLELMETRWAAEISTTEQKQILSRVAALEARSGQIFAAAFAEVAKATERISGYRAVSGAGVEGTIGAAYYRVGNATFVEAEGITIPDELGAAGLAASGAGRSVCYVRRADRIVAVCVFGDRAHAKSATAINALTRMELTLELLSGDAPRAVEQMAGELGIREFQGGVTPERKLARVEALERAGARVAMVGDGVNDAAALSRATVGISAAGSAEVAREAADVFVSAARGPDAIADALRLSRRAMRVIKLNIGIGIAYNVLGATLALTGHVTPLGAAVLMPVSSLTVLIIATKA